MNNQTINLENTLTKYSNFVKFIANSFYVSTGEDFEDLYQEGFIALYNGLKKAKLKNPEKPVPTTYLGSCITFHLINYTKKLTQIKFIKAPFLLEEMIIEEDSFQEELTPDAKIISDHLYLFCAELDLETNKNASSFIVEQMMSLGWTKERSTMATKDLVNVLVA